MAWMLAALGGCAATPTLIISEPSDALIQINGTSVGNAPVSYLFDFAQEPSATVQASKTGYFLEQVLITDKDKSRISDGQLLMKLDEDESYPVTTSSEATNAWVRVQVDSSVDKDTMWQRIVDAVTSRYPSLEAQDNLSGYIRSAYVARKFRSRRGDFEVRSRFLGAIANKDPLVYKLKIESDVRSGPDDWRSHTRMFREDQQLVEEIQSRIGIR